MGTTADELRQQVDTDRSNAEDKINKIQQQVTDSAQMVQDKATETVQQVKEQFDWRRQVNDRPMMALGAAMLGGMLLGKATSDQSGGNNSSSGKSGSGSGGSMFSGALQNAFQSSGMTDQIERTMNDVLSMVASRMKDMTKGLAGMTSNGDQSTAGEGSSTNGRQYGSGRNDGSGQTSYTGI